MSEELAIEILKQATLETTTGACEKCPRKDKNKTCIGCLDEAKEKALGNLHQKENIIKEVREYIKRKDICIDTRKTDGSMDYVDLEKELLEILDKEVK